MVEKPWNSATGTHVTVQLMVPKEYLECFGGARVEVNKTLPKVRERFNSVNYREDVDK